MKSILVSSITGLLLLAGLARAHAGFQADLEGGRVYTGYNDVQIPGDSGTRFSLKDDIPSDPAWFYRARLSYLHNGRHYVSLLASPLRVQGKGRADRDILFSGSTFAAGTEIKSEFRFDSYRATYRYNFLVTDRLILGAGLTGKIRDASITLENEYVRETKSNTGFVPLINFSIEGKLTPSLSLLLEGDALFSRYGRAEDVMAALQYRPVDRVAVRAGYRVLEGGADNSEVYTFSLFHYALAGVTLFF